MSRNQPATIHGDGEQSRDFCYVENVVNANLLSCSAPVEKVAGKSFNIACGKRYSINSLVGLLNEMLGKQTPPKYIPPRNGDVRDSLADIGLARQGLGYEPCVDFAEGLRLTVDWFLSQP
jgi:UDP-glucose 4-epimerase